MIEAFAGRLPYVAFAALVAIGLYVVIDDENLVKKVIGLNIFQTGIFLFFLSLGYRSGAGPPILDGDAGHYVDPLPQVLILTAIVVGVSVSAVALALIVRIYREYGTVREDALREAMADE